MNLYREVDKIWLDYKRNNDFSKLKSLTDLVKSKKNILLEDFHGSVLYHDLVGLFDSYKEVFKKNEKLSNALSGLFDNLNSNEKGIFQTIFVKVLDHPNKVVPIRNLDGDEVYKVSEESNVSQENLNFLISLLSGNGVNAVSFLISLAKNESSSFKCQFSFATNMMTFTGVLCDGVSLLLVSRKNVIDGVYIFDTGLLIVRNETILPSISPFHQQIVKSPEFFVFDHERSVEVVNAIKEKRPAHVFFDFMFADYEIRERISEFAVNFSRESGYFEESMIPFYSNVSSAGNGVFFRRQKRLTEDKVGDRFRNWIVSTSKEGYFKDLNQLDSEATYIWLGIASGERRSWLNEVEGICSIIEWAKSKFEKVFFIFDGYTGRGSLSDHDKKYIDYQQNQLKNILNKASLQSHEFCSLIGARIFEKVAYASICSFYVTMSGTCANWVSNICKVPGVVYSSSKTLRQDANVCVSRTFITPVEFIEDKSLNIKYDEKDRARFTKEQLEIRFTDYTIDVKNFIKFIDESFNSYYGVDD